MNLDFSEWHPLDHWPWEARCHSLYGGWRRHVSLWWTYQGDPREAVRSLLHRPLCWAGRHKPDPFWTSLAAAGDDGRATGHLCRWCNERLD